VGRLSANVALVAVLGPALLSTSVYVSVPPALGVAVLATLLRLRSATRPTVMVAVPVLFPGVVSVVPGGVLTVATLAIVPLAVPETLAWKLTVMAPPGGRVTVPLRALLVMLKLPVLAPPPTALVTLLKVPRPVGRLSANVALVAVLGPALLSTSVYVSVPPALGVAVLATLLRLRSATRPTVMVAVPVLFPGVVSVVPGGVLTVATLAIVPLAVPETLAWKLTVMAPPGGRVTVPLRALLVMLKLPVLAPPPTALVTLLKVPRPVGRLSANVALVAVLGPALLSTSVYVSVPPALGVAVLATLLRLRSATRPTVMVAVPVLFPGVVSVVPGGVLTVATLAIVPLAVPETLAWKLTVMAPPGGRVTVPLRALLVMLKLPVLAPPPTALVTLLKVPRPVGRLSANVALVAVLGPALLSTSVYVSVPPALGVAVLATLLRLRSATRPTVMVAVPVLFPGVVSVVPGGVLTVATLAIVPLAVPETLAWKLTVMAPPGGRVTVPLRALLVMLKLPVLAPPPTALVTLLKVPRPVGRLSANVALVAVLGPALLSTSVYVSVPPALGVAVLATLLRLRSATRPTVMVAVPVLFPGVVSVVPGGVLTVATLAIVPLAVPETLAWKLTVMAPPGGRVTVPLRALLVMLKLPVLAPPPTALVTLLKVPRPVGRLSANVALVAVLGPALLSTSVYVSVPPALGVAVLATLLRLRSATRPTVMVAVPVLFPGVVSVVPGGVLTVATLAIVPLAVPETLAWKLTVMAPPGGRVTVPLRALLVMLKLPVLAPPPTALVTLLKVPRPVGRLSANVALVAVLGPALLSTSVYVSVPPALGVAVLATLLRLRSATRPTVMVAVPVLFPGVVSVVPGGVLTVATLAIVPLAVPETLAWKLTVMAPPGGRVTVPLRALLVMLKLPVLAPPPTALVTLLKVPRPVGRLSANVALVAVLGPALLSTSVYVSVPPALGVAVLATLLRLRSATRPTVMVAVPVLFPGVVSVVPGGVLTVATLAIVPLAVPETLAWKLTVMAPPGGRVTVPLRALLVMLKLPVLAPPPTALVTLLKVPRPVGRLSANVALVAVLGPALLSTSVYVSVPPALGVAVLATLLRLRSATRPTVMVAVPVLFPGVVSVVPGGVLTVATLAIVPLAVPETLAWKLTVMAPPGGRVTVPLRALLVMLKLPVLAPPPTALVTLLKVPRPVGRLSANVALVAVLGPALLSTSVYVSVPPALGVAVLATLLRLRSATRPTVMVAVPVLFPGVVSVVPGGVLTVATLAIVPLAVPETLAWKLTVMAPPGGRVTVPLRALLVMLKLPVLAPPPTALVTLLKVPRPVGRLSANVALVAVLGPALLSTSVYVSVPPALGVAVLATLLRLRSATRPTVMVAVPVLFPGVVSVVPGGVLTVATLAIVPLAVPETLAWKLTVMAPPGGRVTVPLRALLVMLKLPVLAPPPTALVTLLKVPRPVGRLSANVALVAVLGPALLSTSVYVSVPPALGVAVLATLLRLRSATRPTVMVAVPVLFPGVVSVVPGGVLTVATLAIVPLAVPETLAWKLTVMAPPGGRVTVPLRALLVMLKLPVLAPPPTALVTLLKVPRPVGRLSANVALVAVLGPALLSTSVYVSVPPALGVAVLATLLRLRSATRPTVMVAVPVLFPGVVSVVPGGVLTVATLAIVPLAVPETLAWKLTVMAPPGGRVTVPLRALLVMLKLPVLAPPPTALVTLLKVPRPVGRLSANVALVAVLGPALLSTSVYVSVPPALGVAVLATLLRLRSATRPTVMVAVPVLFPGVVSVVPGGVLTVATLAIVPLAVPETLAWKLTVMAPPGGRVTVPLRALLVMLKLPVLAPPPTALVTLLKVPRPVGRLSANVALVAVLGPALLSTSVYVSVPPALGVAVLATLLRLRSALLALLMVLVDVLFAGTGSAVVDVIDTVFVIDPPPDPTNTVSVNVPETPEARLAVVSVTLEVLVTKPIEPELRLIWAAVIARPAADKPSVTVTPDAALGPALAKVMM
jgi:hypothetical protein